MESSDVVPKNWLRCNLCFCLMCKSKDPFSLTFCGHIFCNKCIRKATKQCPQCKAQDVPSMILQEPLKPEIKHCFESTEELSEKLRQATLFHDMQRALNCKRLNDLEKKYVLAKNEYHRKSKEVHFLKEKYSKLLKVDESLHKHVQELEAKKAQQSQQTSFMMTPISNVSSMPRSAQSLSSTGSVRLPGQSFPVPEHLQRSVLRPIRHESVSRNGEFRIPSVTRVPRSVGNSMKSSSRASSSSRGTPFSNYTPNSDRS
ncbi:probable E3 SUMO-protein ligase RNF212 [Belonocnema kinseyi]|uniref:probable E3 SUMO-protein ligase RNF212 n=1 Tax=Belonocnema kinseyi TaxID=2817044 RepID=UPI00143DE94B|nr:probable E3 SUMO-protein ligase RNF212 [Belonocnema kinseyi]